MAIGQEFMKSSRYRTEPGEDVSALTTEAAKYGAYLSSLDQYQLGLDEQARQFDETLELEYEKFEFEKESFDESSELDWYKAQTERIGKNDLDDYRDQSIEQGYAELEQDKFKLSDQKDIATLEESTSGTGGKIDYGRTATTGTGGLYSDYYNEDGTEKSWLDSYNYYEGSAEGSTDEPTDDSDLSVLYNEAYGWNQF